MHRNPFNGRCIHGADDAVVVDGKVRSLMCEHCNKQEQVAEELETLLAQVSEPAFDLEGLDWSS